MKNRENISDLPAQANNAPAGASLENLQWEPLLSVSDWKSDLAGLEKAFQEWGKGFNWNMSLNWDVPLDWNTP